MEKYKIYIKGNYFLIEKVSNREIQYGHRKEVLVDKNNLQKPIYRIFNVKDWRQRESLHISQILKEDGVPYTQEEWEVFYTTNTGNFSLGSLNLDPHILDALNNANLPSISNPFATISDVITQIVYGNNNPNIIPPSGTFKAGDNYVQTSTGDSTGTVISIWIYDGTQWVTEGSSPILVTCNNREIWTNATTDTVSVVIYTDGSAAVYDENSVVTNYSTGYNTILTNSGFSLTRTLNCYDSLCLELNQVQYYDNNGSYNFVPTNGGISQTYTQLKVLGAAECGSNVCPQIYSADDVINPNPINTTTGLPTNNPICLNTTSVWVNSSGIVQFTWDIGNQIWVVKPPVAETCSKVKYSRTSPINITLSNTGDWIDLPVFIDEEWNTGAIQKVSNTELLIIESGYFNLSYNTHIFENTTRLSYQTRLVIDGIEITGTIADSYIRDSSGDDEGTTNTSTDVYLTSGDIIKLQGRSESSVSVGTSQLRNSTFSMHALDCGSGYTFDVESVISAVLDNTFTQPPSSTNLFYSYIVGENATGDWLGKDNTIAIWGGINWVFYTPILNDTVLILTGVNSGNKYKFNGTNWELVFTEIEDIHSGVNFIDSSELFTIKNNKEMIVSSLTIQGILNINGILTII